MSAIFRAGSNPCSFYFAQKKEKSRNLRIL
nr:MAG TPA: hypothetical protein [Caudoviricetes sp.]